MHPVSLFVHRARDRTLSPSHPQPVDAAPFDLALASGDGLLDAGRHAAVAWCVLRGRVLVQSREGAFELGPRDWIALDRDSVPTAWLGAGSVVFGVGIDPALQRALQAATDQPVLFPGRGRMPPRARALALRLWSTRNRTATPAVGDFVPDALRRPVSYTHLDVYKRQRLAMSTSIHVSRRTGHNWHSVVASAIPTCG